MPRQETTPSARKGNVSAQKQPQHSKKQPRNDKKITQIPSTKAASKLKTNPLASFDFANFDNNIASEDDIEITSGDDNSDDDDARGLPAVRYRTEDGKTITKPTKSTQKSTAMVDSDDSQSDTIISDEDFDDEDDFDDNWGDLDGDDIETDDDYDQNRGDEEDDPFIAELRAMVERSKAAKAAAAQVKTIDQKDKTNAKNSSKDEKITSKNTTTKSIPKKIDSESGIESGFDNGDDEDDEMDEDDFDQDGEGEFDSFGDFEGEDGLDMDGEQGSFFSYGEGEFDSDFDGFDEEEDSGDEIGSMVSSKTAQSAPLSITERLVAQLRLLQGNNASTNDDDDHENNPENDNNEQHSSNSLLFGSVKSSKTTNTPGSSHIKLTKQDKAVAIRKQLLLYQQQLKIRLFLQQPQGLLEQLPLDPQSYVQLAALDLQDNGVPNVQLTAEDEKKMKKDFGGLDMGLDSNEAMSLLRKGGKVRKFDSLLHTDIAHDDPYIFSSFIDSGHIPYSLTTVLGTIGEIDSSDDEDDFDAKKQVIETFYKQPFVKKMKLSQAITSQTLADLIKIEHMMSRGAGAKEYVEGEDNIDDDDDEKGKKKKSKSDNLSATMLLSEKYEDLVHTNQLLKGLTARATANVVQESIQGNIDLYKENLEEKMGEDSDNDDDNEVQNPIDQLSKKISQFSKDQENAQLLLSTYEQNYDQIEDYLETLYTTSLPRINNIIDKWEKRTNAGITANLGQNLDLSSLSIPLSQQINTTLVTEKKRLVQKSRLRRFSFHQLCHDPTVERKSQQEYYDGLIGYVNDDGDDEGNDEKPFSEARAQIVSILHQLGAVTNTTAVAMAAQERFDEHIYDDFDFTPTLIKDINNNLGDFHSGTNFLNLNLKQLQEQQDNIKKQLKQTTYQAQHGATRHGQKKNVKIGQVNQKSVNFVVPRPNIAWARANGMEFNSSLATSSNKDDMNNAAYDLKMRETIDQALGATTSDAIFVDNLFLHLFGQHQNRTSHHASHALEQKQRSEDARTKGNEIDDGVGQDGDDEDEDFDYGDDDVENDHGHDGDEEDDESEIDLNDLDKDEAEYGGGGMGGWF